MPFRKMVAQSVWMRATDEVQGGKLRLSAGPLADAWWPHITSELASVEPSGPPSKNPGVRRWLRLSVLSIPWRSSICIFVHSVIHSFSQSELQTGKSLTGEWFLG